MLQNKICLIIFLAILILEASAREASLVTEQGENHLVGSFCPGTTQLFCNGQDLTFLRWRSFSYAKEVERYIIFRAKNPMFGLQNSAFLSVNFSINASSDTTRANFFSVLTVDLDKLQAQNVTNISCGGGASVEAEIPVNITIISPSAPDIPNITNVSAFYQNGVLESVVVVWIKLHNPVCGLSLTYQVNLTGFEPLQVNHTSCGTTYCSTKFIDTAHKDSSSKILTLEAMMESSTSEVASHQLIISQQREEYFTYEVNVSTCHTMVQCVTAQTLDDNTSCVIRYTTDPTYENLKFINEDSLPLNTIYYVEFSLLVNILLVREKVVVMSGSYGDFPMSSKKNTHLAVTILFLIIILVHIIGILIMKKVTRKSKFKILFFLVGFLAVFSLDIILLLSFAIITSGINGMCSVSLPAPHDSLLEAMLTIACLGCFCLVPFWLIVCFWHYQLHKLCGTKLDNQTKQEDSTKEEYDEVVVYPPSSTTSNKGKEGSTLKGQTSSHKDLAEDSLYKGQSCDIYEDPDTDMGNSVPVADIYEDIDEGEKFSYKGQLLTIPDVYKELDESMMAQINAYQQLVKNKRKPESGSTDLCLDDPTYTCVGIISSAITHGDNMIGKTVNHPNMSKQLRSQEKPTPVTRKLKPITR